MPFSSLVSLALLKRASEPISAPAKFDSSLIPATLIV
jgi:hypothetical protein